MYPRRSHLLLSLTLALMPFAAVVSADIDEHTENNTAEQPLGNLPLDDLRTFTMVFDHIRRSYVEEISDSTLLENAISGLLGKLDPHSVYLDDKAFASLKESTSGAFSGIGIEVSMSNDAVKVIAPIDNTPAFNAGVKSGDLIIKIDDTLVKGLSQSQAIKLMRGPRGSAIQLTIIREAANTPLIIDLKRDLIKTKSVRSRLLEPGYGYVRIAQFQLDTGQQFRLALRRLSDGVEPLKGLILDLRRNPGGLLPASIEVCDAVMNEGLITYTEGRLPSANSRYEAKPGDVIEGVAMVVILDGGSASASEIVAGALQDNNRAIVIGTQSFGKGSVQTVMPISATRGIKLTTAHYFTPSGRSIQAQGITPDIEVKYADVVVANNSHVTEASLNGHLNNPNGKQNAATEVDVGNLITTDNQLFEGLNILKGAYLLSSKRIQP